MKPVRFPSEEMRKEQLFVLKKAPRMVYLSTHAYAHLPSRVHVDDPLLSCALACAGWNYLPEPRADVPQSLPGMMTGAEIMAIDLRGTELVVIASCQTGAELLAPGHSPASLRHAFHIAGARSVVSALWTMNDRTTLEVMEPFMAEACKPGSKVNALRSAQRQSMRYLEMYREHTHPYYWAGFTLSGG
jgi:CHAT domain-containing protein